MSTQLKQLTDILQKLETERFYGRIELQYRAGAVELVRQERTMKLNNEGNSRNDHFTR